MGPVLILFLSLLCRPLEALDLYEKNNSDSYLSTLQIIRKYGYPAESHFTTTEDGYILELHRIPRGKTTSFSKARGPPVFLQHGFLGSSADFVIIGPGKALPFLLADEGYDVWLGNIRGNTYSRAHKTLTPSDRKFWNFTWHESGMYDVPAQIDFICNYTGYEKIIYTGYSMGTTMFFVMMSLRPEYQTKVEAAVLLAAIAYLANTKSPIRYLAPFASNVQILSEILSDGEFIQQSTLYRYITRLACTLNTFERDLCRNMIFLYTGCDPFQFDERLLPSILNHIPAGTSSKTLTHFAQLIQSGRFEQFDYGPVNNLQKYRSRRPPSYNLNGINTPIYIFEGKNDFLSDQTDVQSLVKRLPNVRDVRYVNFSHFNHFDFVFATDVKTLLYEDVLNVVRRLSYDTESDYNEYY